jgi:hypothetical protein
MSDKLHIHQDGSHVLWNSTTLRLATKPNQILALRSLMFPSRYEEDLVGSYA